MFGGYSHYTKEEAETLINQVHQVQDIRPNLRQRRPDFLGKTTWTLRDLQNWEKPEFRDMVLGALKYYVGGKV